MQCLNKCVIDDVILKKDLLVEPSLVTFANGVPLQNVENKITASIYHNIEKDIPARKRNRIMKVETPNMIYKGVINPKEDDGQVQEDIFLGVYDPATGKMKLVEMSCFNLQPQVKPITTTNKLLLDSVHSRTFDEKQEDVASGFGSKRAKQQVNRRKQYQTNAEQMATAMNRAISAADIKEEEMDDATTPVSYADVLPPCNRAGGRIEDVYKLSEIVNDEILSPLNEEAKQLLNSESKKDIKLNMLMEELLFTIKLEDEDRRIYLTSVALLVNYLIKFLNIKHKELKKRSDVIPGCPRQVENMILGGFTEGQWKHRSRTKKLDDKVYCYILVLSLIVNKYNLTLSCLRQTLTYSNEQVDLLMRAIGATKLANVYKLQLPLQKISIRRKKLKPKRQ